jgi:hypothetical protein
VPHSKFACAVAILFLTVAAAAQESSLAGRWTATLKKGDRTGAATLTVSVSGNEVSGTLSDPSGQIWQLQNGKFEANQLPFDVSAREHGGTKNIHFFGQVEGDSITMHKESNGRPGQIMIFHKIKD